MRQLFGELVAAFWEHEGHALSPVLAEVGVAFFSKAGANCPVVTQDNLVAFSDPRSGLQPREALLYSMTNSYFTCLETPLFSQIS